LGELAFLASPTDSGLFMAGVAVGMQDKRAFLADRETAFASGLRQWPELWSLLEGASRVGPIRVMTEWHGYFREATGPGWVLVGDAGHFKDFTPAQGISDALRQGHKLAGAIEQGLDQGGRRDSALEAFWHWRDDDAVEMHWFASDIGRAGSPSPLINRILRDIGQDADATNSFVRLLNHDLPPSKLFTPGRMARSAARALRDRPDLARATTAEIWGALRDEAQRSRKRRTARRMLSRRPS
jgi:flavin-dependent dehydrogenase